MFESCRGYSMKCHEKRRKFSAPRQHNCVPFAWIVFVAVVQGASPTWALNTSASSAQQGFSPAGAIDENRFDTATDHVWKGNANDGSWWWQCRWDEPRDVGAILQIVGDDPLVLQNAPRKYVWQASLDGQTWSDIEGTAVVAERRTFRLRV